MSTETTVDDTATAVTVLAPAKVNLFLHVLARRDDGYHELDSLFAFTELGDRLSVSLGEELSLTVSGPFGAQLPDDPRQNLVFHAAETLRTGFSVSAGAAIHLEKNLPVASGIGGGSADAAAALRALAHLWAISRQDESVQSMARQLGADVPACLQGRTAIIGGIGDRISPTAELPPVGIVLVNPGAALSTPQVFANCRPHNRPIAAIDPWPQNAVELADALRGLGNDLTVAACSLVPAIGEVLGILEQAPETLLARMSGSGATCFALCADFAAARSLAPRVQSAHPDWWVAATQIARVNGQTP